METFKINEISAVDKPAQAHAKALIMKRVDDDEEGDDRDIDTLAKALVEECVDVGVTAQEFEAQIAKRAADAFPGLSSAQQYTRFITSDPAGKLLFKASTMAARSVAQGRASDEGVRRRWP